MIVGRYKHYKGGYYEVLGIALHTETNEKMVVYRALYQCVDLLKEYGKNPLFVRPYKDFFEKVNYKGSAQSRFNYVGNTEA